MLASERAGSERCSHRWQAVYLLRRPRLRFQMGEQVAHRRRPKLK